MPEARSDSAPPEFLAALEKWWAVKDPGPEHALLESMVGAWSVTIRFHGGEEPFETVGRAEKHLLHGGRFLLEELEGEIHAPDASGGMRPEPYSATRLLGYDRYRNSWTGAFVENQNTHLLTYRGTPAPGGTGVLVLFGESDEPMLDLAGTTLRHVLRVDGPDRHVWEVSAMAAGGRRVFDFVYGR